MEKKSISFKEETEQIKCVYCNRKIPKLLKDKFGRKPARKPKYCRDRNCRYLHFLERHPGYAKEYRKKYYQEHKGKFKKSGK